MTDRRRDPRTDAHVSLVNLLRVRTTRHGLALALLLTADGLLMAGSQTGVTAERMAAHAAQELFQGPADRVNVTGRRTGARLSALRFQSEGRPLAVAVLSQDQPLSREELEDIALRVRRILAEADQRAAAA
ncbi:MAG: hypothetical protein AB7N76_28760 [Planctomycetota bacterium]